MNSGCVPGDKRSWQNPAAVGEHIILPKVIVSRHGPAATVKNLRVFSPSRPDGQVLGQPVACYLNPATSTECQFVSTTSSLGPTVVLGETASPHAVVIRHDSAVTGEGLEVFGPSGC